MTDHERWSDSAAAYLLGALPDDELRAFEAHLAECPLCREEVDELAPAALALPSAVDPVTPPPALKARIMAEVEREAALMAAAGPEADRPARAPAPARRRTWFGLPRFAPAAIAALLLIGVAIGIGVTQLGGSSARTVQARVLDKSRAPRASAEVEVSSDGATLIAHGLPAPPSGRVYQVWLKRAGHAPEPTSALFTPRRDGTATATVPGSLSGVDQMLVTDEPSGGSRQPTTSPLLAATVS